MDLKISLSTVVLDCPDAHELAAFYQRLLGWELTIEEDDWVLMRHPAGGTGLSFQTEEWYVRPVWPDEEGMPTKMLHLDFVVSDLAQAVEHALQCGAEHASVQYFETVHVMLDPAGHPFCLFKDD